VFFKAEVVVDREVLLTAVETEVSLEVVVRTTCEVESPYDSDKLEFEYTS
jgi:hypothetical protein